jgi:hypothetical protein
MALDPKVLTNDMTLARAARRADKLAQATIQPQPPTSFTSTAPAVAAAPRPTATAPIVWTPMGATPAPQADDASVRTMKFRLSVLKGDEAKLQANLDYLMGKSSAAPAGLSGTTSATDWNLLVQKLNAVQDEIQKLETKLGPAANQ